MANFSISSGINEPWSNNGLGAYASGSVWQGNQSIEGNYTDVGWSISAALSEYDGYTWGGGTRGDIGTCRMIINGTVVGQFGMSLNTGATNGSSLGSTSGSTRIYHNGDGSKTITAYIDFVQGSSDMHVSSTSSGVQSITLSTIPRASVPSVSQGTVQCGSTVVIYTNRKARFTHKLTYRCGNASGTIGTNVEDSINWTVPKELLEQFTTALTGTCTIYCETYSGSTKMGDTKTCTLTLSLPSDALPTVAIDSITENNANVKKYAGEDVTIQNISEKTITVTVGTHYGATIKTVIVSNGSVSKTLTSSGTVTLSGLSSGLYAVTVVDSRTASSTARSTQTYKGYRAPQITVAHCERENQTSANGTLEIKGIFTNIYGNKIYVSMKRIDKDTENGLATVSNNDFTFAKNYTDLAYTNAYKWVIAVGDNFEQTSSTTVMLSASTPTFWLGRDEAILDGQFICKNVTTGELAVNGKSILDMTYPVGSIYMSINNTNPQTLFGGTWEQLKDRFLLGAGNTYAAGNTGGEATHTLTVSEMPSHDHGIKMNVSGYEGGIAYTSHFGQGDPQQWDNYQGLIGSTGGNNAHNNMPPYLVVYMWKRTK